MPGLATTLHEDWTRPLDNELYSPSKMSKIFYKKETKIDDEEELKQHILRVQSRAFEKYNYPCLRVFQFMRLMLSDNPAYDKLLDLGRSRECAILLDLGCCFGQESRKAISDGYPIENVVTSDLNKDFWALGHELFRSTHETYPVPFIPGDIFDSNFLEQRDPIFEVASDQAPPPDSLNSLNPLLGHVSAIITCHLFHLFSEEKQEEAARRLAGLLSPEPGSMIIGVHGGREEKGFYQPNGPTATQGQGYRMFCHSPKSWTDLWEAIFGENKVHVEARLKEDLGGTTFFGTFPGSTVPYYVMEWCVVRK